MLAATRLGLSTLLVVCLPQLLATAAEDECKNDKFSAYCNWQYPCGGQVGLDTEEMVKPDPNELDRELGRTLWSTVQDIQYLKNSVKKILREFITHRFRDEELAKEAEDNYFQGLRGFTPKLRSNDTQTSLTLSQAVLIWYEDFSKFSILVMKMLAEEKTEDNGRVSFEAEYTKVQMLVTTILCKLRMVLLSLSVSFPSNVKGDIKAVQLTAVPTRAVRQMRDYIVLRNLEMTLDVAGPVISSFAKTKYPNLP